MNLCFSTLGCTERSLEDIISLAARYGTENLELRGMSGSTDISAIPEFFDENIGNTKEMLLRAGISPAVLGTSCAFHSEKKLAAALDEGRRSITLAKKLGIPYIRVFGNKFGDDRMAATQRVIDGIGELCDFAAGSGVSVLLEVHGDFCNEAALSPIVCGLRDRENFGIIWDIAHSHADYGNDFQRFYDFIVPYTRHVHLKDFDSGTGKLVLPGRGDIPIVPIVKALLDGGFGSCFSLEWERLWHPGLPPIEEALDSLIALLSDAGLIRAGAYGHGKTMKKGDEQIL